MGILLAAAGSYFVVTNGTVEFMSDWEMIVGGMFGVICAAFWAIYTVEGLHAVDDFNTM